MGRVKLLFRPEYFIHGTPESTSVERPASHGCVRLRNADAIELAATLLRDHLSAAVIDSLIRDTTTRRSFPIAPPVPLEVIYRLLEVDRDSVRVYRNVYHLTISPALLHTQAMAQLGEAGIDTVAVDRRQLDRVIRQGVARGAVVPIDGVLQKR
jgi:murein L,D-transpeptidase YcbB/YkuD